MFRPGHLIPGLGTGADGSLALGLISSLSLGIPENVVATTGQELVTITWDAVLNAVSYNIYWAETAGVSTLSTKIEGVTSPYVHDDLPARKYFYYRVSAVNSFGVESELSEEVSAITGAVAEVPPGFFDPPSVVGVVTRKVNMLDLVSRLDTTREQPTVEYRFSNNRRFRRRSYE